MRTVGLFFCAVLNESLLSMKFSTVLLSASTLMNATAAFLSSHVVVPALRSAGNLKAKGLKRAFTELDMQYWKQIDGLVAARKLVQKLEREAKSIDTKRISALRESKRHDKERML